MMKASLASVVPVLVPRQVRMARRHDRPRPSIPGWLRKAVYAADRYRCVYCGSQLKLQLDHIIPWSFGGLSTLWNLVTLCGRCNRIKSNYWKSDTGKVYYRAWADANAMGLAGLILKRELAARRSPLRWVRAARTWWF
jgi:5-methylcytosine-specific restriction endonuclease McrA